MTHVDLSSVRDASTGDFNLSDLERAVNTKETNNVTVRSWLQKAGKSPPFPKPPLSLLHLHPTDSAVQPTATPQSSFA